MGRVPENGETAWHSYGMGVSSFSMRVVSGLMYLMVTIGLVWIYIKVE